MSGLAALTNQLKKLLVGMGDGTNLGGQVKNDPTTEAEVKCPKEGDPAGSTIRSPNAGDPAASDPENDKSDADSPGTDILRIIKLDWWLCNLVT